MQKLHIILAQGQNLWATDTARIQYLKVDTNLENFWLTWSQKISELAIFKQVDVIQQIHYFQVVESI